MKLDNVDDTWNRKRKRDWKLGSWNIRTMLQPGKMNEIADELKKYNMDIVALQELRWRGSGEISKKDYTLHYSGSQKKAGRNGTGFWIGKDIKKKILGFEPINERICKLRVKGLFTNITLISAYAPTEDADEEIKDIFYANMEETFLKVNKYDTVIILGDFNAKIGSEIFIKNIAGKHSLHETTSENGIRLCNFASATSTFIMSTAFPHKDIHKGTWRIPGSHAANQIDHVLICNRRRSSITDVRSLRGPNCDSDHFLVRVNIRQKLSNAAKIKGVKRLKWNTAKLVDKEVKIHFQREMDQKITQTGISKSIEKEWKLLKIAITTAASTTIGRSVKNKNSEWYDDECISAITTKNQARKNWLDKKTRAAEENYIKKRRIATKLCQKKKREAMKKNLENICEDFISNNTRKFYSQVKTEKRGFQPRINICKSKSGEVLTEQLQITERWVEYFKELLNADSPEGESQEEAIITDKTNTMEKSQEQQPPTLDEILDAINCMKNHKSPGEDNITAELLKNASSIFIERIQHLTSLIWEQETLPKDWNVALIIPIHKKGEKENCKNYRGISLLNTAYKILARIINNRLIKYAEKILPEYQCGFRPGRSTSDQIFALKQSMEKCYEHNIDLHMLFIDFKQAFDTVNRRTMPPIFKKCKIPEKLIRLIMMTLRNTESKIMIQDNKSEAFHIQSGVRQGDTLSSTIFNLMLCCVIDEVNDAKRTGHIMNRTTQIYAYADDIAIVSKTKSALVSTFSEIEAATAKIGLKINDEKTKYMLLSRLKNKQPSKEIDIGKHEFEVVSTFTYLGCKLTTNNSMSPTIEERIQAANRAYASLTKLFKSKLLNRPCKLTLYKTVIRPVLCYGAETWTLSEKYKKKLQTFERKVLRKIFGAVRIAQDEWRIRWNDELDELINGENVVRYIKAQRIRWLGHVMRMDSSRAQRKMLEAKAYTNKAKGRPRSRWIDEVKEDLEKLNLKNWKETAADRAAWRCTVQQAKAHKKL